MVTGGGQFTDDISLPGQLYLKVLRSPFAHGHITQLDLCGIRSLPGVKAVYTAADLEHLGGLPCRAALKNPDGSPAFIPRRPILAEQQVAFAGQAVAAVVADTAHAAENAVERIVFDVEEVPANTSLERALHADTAVIHADHGSNLCVTYDNGKQAEVDAALADADHVVSLDLVNNRVAPSPLESRACLAVCESSEEGDQFTVYNPSQGVFAQQGVLSKAIFKTDPQQIRVVSSDTGGGFGIRGEIHPEVVLCMLAAQQLNKPVKYCGSRSEMFLTDNHGRDNLTTVTGGFDAQGRLLAVRVDTVANLGAYCTAVGPFVPTVAGGRIVGTVYDVPVLHHRVRPVFTNTMPVGAYRGAGRPEACYVMERLLESAAHQLSLDAIELRRLNFISPQKMPFTMPSGVDLTCGEFAETLDLGVARSDWRGFADRQRESRSRGRLRGRGLGYYVESSGGGMEEEAVITLNDDGSVDVVVGTYSHGQGHRTTYSQVLSETLGIEFDKINIVQGDSASVRFGGGTGGSRSAQMGSIAAVSACRDMLEDAHDVAAELLQSDRDMVSYTQGHFTSGSNQSSVTLAQVAKAAQEMHGTSLTRVHRYKRAADYSFPNGCHVAEVEIDPDTGVVEVVRYVAVDDCGRVINPLLAGGQVHGGVVQGIGQTLYEQVIYDEDGQLLTGTLMDYTMPRASQVPDIEVSFNEVLDPHNELGVKGIGEGGACGAPPAVVHAVLDVLREVGVYEIDMPLTSEKVWRLLRGAQTD